MKTLPDNSIDACITDPPYYSTNLHFDKEPRIDFEYLLHEIKRILKPAGVLVSFADFNLLAELRGYKVFKSTYELIWQKNMATGMLNCNDRPLKNHEFIGVFTSSFKKSTYNPIKFNFQSSRFKVGESNKASGLPATSLYGNYADKSEYIENGTRHPLSIVYAQNWNGGIARDVAKGNKRHPTQKPLDLLEWLVKSYTNENDIILDPFAGSGTTLVAAKNLSRRAIGCELHEPYYEIAKARIENAKQQQDLF